jgi:hypothetical protein
MDLAASWQTGYRVIAVIVLIAVRCRRGLRRA